MSKQRNTFNAVCKLCRRNRQEHEGKGKFCPIPKDQGRGIWAGRYGTQSHRGTFTIR